MFDIMLGALILYMAFKLTYLIEYNDKIINRGEDEHNVNYP
jgi:hypothetical protein